MATKREIDEKLQAARQFLEGTESYHAEIMRKVDRRSNAYHAILDIQREAAARLKDSWQSQLYPPYVMHIVDSTLASMVESNLRFKIRPRVTPAMGRDPELARKAREGAEAHQALSDWQMRQSKFTRIQRPFLLQNAIAGITVAKTRWSEQLERRRQMEAVEKPLLDEFDDPIIDYATGQPMTYVDLQETVRTEVVYDGPITEVIDVHDFRWMKSARDMTSSRYIGHRFRISFDELEEGFKDGGPYGPQRGGWSWQKVKKELGETREMKDSYGTRWGHKGESRHDEGLLELWEVYDQFKKCVVTMIGANNGILLAYSDEMPFHHEQPPFVVCTTQPDLFEFVGISQVEKVQALQEMLWRMMNQRVDNVQLLNNAIVMYRPDLHDADALPFEPGAMWPMEDPEQVKMWSPDPIPAEISLGSEALLKGDMQNLASTFPFSSGAESQTVDQKTATGASIVSALAQRSIDMAKQPVYDSLQDIGQQRLILTQQFTREPTFAVVLGLDDQDEIMEILPDVLTGDYEFVQEPIPDALMVQQEQAKMQAAVQVITQAMPVISQLAAMGMASMINFDALMQDYLKALGIEDPVRYFLSRSPQGAVGGAGAGGGGGAPEQQALGITAGPGGQEPGSQMMDSPATNMQRALAMGGGGGENV